MSLGDLLAKDLLGWMEKAPDGVPRRVVLWLDPERQFARLVDALSQVNRVAGRAAAPW